MRLYAVDDELRVRVGRDLRAWTKAGYITPTQDAALRADLVTGLRRTGAMLRLGLAAFTVIAGAAAIGLVMLVTDLTSEVAITITTAVLGVAAMATASWLVRRYRLYRYGVEEALAMGAVGLFGASAGALGGEMFGANGGAPWGCAMAAAALAAGYTYRRFGFQYAAVVSLCAIALVPMAFDSVGMDVTRVVAALVFAGGYAYAKTRRHTADDDITRCDAEVLRAAAATGAYLALNVALTGEVLAEMESPAFRWACWLITWLLPFAVGRAAVLERDPWLLRVAMAMMLASLATNKTYLGWTRQPWDPMVLGVMLAVVALWLRRWLAAGSEGERHGYTARPLVDSDERAMQLASLASVAVQPAHVRDVPEPQPPTFSGGRSGGGGASSDF
ncbi:MAG: hypothetical protein U0P30_10445 [Vicinamibacterales bacterium]